MIPCVSKGITMNKPSENPFETPESDIGKGQRPKSIHPIVFVLVSLLSIVLGGCTFFCTCFGLFMLNVGDGDLFWFVTSGSSLLAMVRSYWGIVSAIRRSRRRAAERQQL